jgi:hypothetical protein
LAITNFYFTVFHFLNNLNSVSKVRLAKEGYDMKFLLQRIANSKLVGISKLYEEYTGNSANSIFDLNLIKTQFEKILLE